MLKFVWKKLQADVVAGGLLVKIIWKFRFFGLKLVLLVAVSYELKTTKKIVDIHTLYTLATMCSK